MTQTKQEFKDKLLQKVKHDLSDGIGCPTDFLFGMVKWEIENEQELSKDSVNSLLFLISSSKHFQEVFENNFVESN